MLNFFARLFQQKIIPAHQQFGQENNGQFFFIKIDSVMLANLIDSSNLRNVEKQDLINWATRQFLERKINEQTH